jgi:hypothetical protein
MRGFDRMDANPMEGGERAVKKRAVWILEKEVV